MVAVLSRMIATLGGLGQSPIAPGTLASLAAAAVWSVLPLSRTAQWVACTVFGVVGLWAAGHQVKAFRHTDPSQVVIDEWTGMWLALAGLPKTASVVIAGLFLFRFFDIGKFPPMKQLEHLHGGWGIMLDDVAAGLISRVVLGVLVWLFPRLAGVG